MYLPYVNVKIGTDSEPRFSHGNTLPLTQLPFAMASFCPQTEVIAGREGWFYKPNAPYLEGIRLTHQPSPWIEDYGTLLLTPQNDIISKSPSQAWSGMDTKASVLCPHYLSVDFLRYGCHFELTPTLRGGAVRLKFKGKSGNYLTVFGIKGDYTYTLDKENGVLLGTTNGHSKDASVNFKMYFAISLPRESVDYNATFTDGNNINVALKGDTLDSKIGISYISHTLAIESMEKGSFDELVKKAQDCWEEKLQRIEIETDNEEQKRTFYSCMYRAFLFPHMGYEIQNGEKVHYSFFDGSVKKGVKYTDTGFWDTARTQFPLFSLIAREEYEEILEGIVNDYIDSGYLPRWHSYGEVGCMPSTLVDGVILEAVVNKIGSAELWEKALYGMIHHANNKAGDKRYGREGVLDYLKYGYVPCDLYKESVNLTLDAAYGDWCISKIAHILDKEKIAAEYEKRGKNYKNLFDKKTGFMRARKSNGEFKENFDPISWGGDYTEGSAWQTTFFVPHDIEGLIELYGGKDELIKKLDELFDTPPVYRVGGYGSEIHEMTEMACVDFGQCAISNQPSFHIPYLYAYLGKKEKTEYWVGRMCNELFNSTPKGFPGDEDNGSMASWYILSTLGMYPLCVGSGELIRIKPLVKSAKILKKKIF